MELSSWASLAFVCMLTLAFISRTIFKQKPKKKPPPGPKPWPIIGNLDLVGSIPHQSFHNLSKKYGDLMQLKFGKFPVVVASSSEMAKQFLKTHDRVFAYRPKVVAGKYIGYNYSNMASIPYGPCFRQARKIYFSEVFNAKTLASSEYILVDERRKLLSRLHTLSGKPVVIRDHLKRLALMSTSRMIIGNKYFSESSVENSSAVTIDEFQGMSDEWFLLYGAFNIGDWIPWLSFLDLQGYVKKMKVLQKKFDSFMSYVVDDHQSRKAAQKDFVPKDVVDAFLKLAENPNLEFKLTSDSIKALVEDLLLGGTDTAAATVEWAMLAMVKQPRIIEKAKEELDRVIGRNRWVEENDYSQLPYIEAIMMESMRLNPLVTFLVPRYAIEDCKVAGYEISKGTTVLVNTWSIGRDPNSWDSPEEFLPERFLNKETDIVGNNFALLPFGSGRRMCPGYSLGLKIVRTVLANLIHGFNWRLPDGVKAEDVSMEEEYGLTTHAKVPLTIIMEPTLPLEISVDE